MKESGIDWIGQIPEEWEVIKFKFLGDVKQGLTYSPSDIVDKDEGILVLRSGNIQNGVLDFTNNVYVKTKVAESIVLRKNDILITARNGSSALIGKNAIIDTDIKATFGAFMMVFRTNKSLIAKFAFYLMNISFNFYRTFFTTSTVNQLTAAIFNGIEVPLPSISEQQKIAYFLDKKTAQLDKAKNLLEEQIQKLKDYRASLIYETVTKGLDKTVPMKDSGIDWIGQVPEGWGVKPLKYLASYDDETLTQSEINSNQKINYVDIGAVEFTKGINGYQELLMSEAPSRARKIAKKGDTIISTVRTYLKAIAYLNDDYIVSTGFCVVHPKKVNSKYLNYTIMSDSFTGPVSKYAWGVSYPAISSSQLVNIPIPFPESIEEQLSIVDYLDHKMLQINQLIDIKQEQIDNINKQRQTLIYDYVIGKRRV